MPRTVLPRRTAPTAVPGPAAPTSPRPLAATAVPADLVPLPTARLEPDLASGDRTRVPQGVVALAVAGDLDTGGAERLRALLDDALAPGRTLVLDLAGVVHLSSAALAVLVSAHRRLRDGGGSLVVARPSAAVVRVLRVSGLHRVIPVDPPA